MLRLLPNAIPIAIWFTIGIVWFVAYENIRERRARNFPGQSTQTCLMALFYNCGCLVILGTIWILLIGEILWLRAQRSY